MSGGKLSCQNVGYLDASFYMFTCSSSVTGVHTGLHIRFVLGEEGGLVKNRDPQDSEMESLRLVYGLMFVAWYITKRQRSLFLNNSSDDYYGLWILMQIEGKGTVRIWRRDGPHGL